MANYTSVIASNICDAAGNKLASGTVSFQATDAANQPLNFQVGGGGQVVTTPATAAITAGAIAGGFQVADSANTSPAGILYRITITDTTLNRVVVTYSLVTVTGTTFNLDNFSQTGAAVLPPVGGSVFGPLTVAGSLSVTGGLVSGSLVSGVSTVSSLNKVIYVDQQPGATADVKFANACAALLAAGTGGTLDARGFGPTTQTIAATVSCGDASHEVTFIGDQSTNYVPGTTSVDMFQVNPGSSFRDFYVISNGVNYTGNAFKFANNIYDNKQSTLTQLSGLINIRCDFAALTTGVCVLLQSDDVNYVSYVSGLHIRCSGGAKCIYMHAGGSSAGKWIADNHMEDVQCSGVVNCYSFVADAGNMEGNLCIHCTAQYVGGISSSAIVQTNNVTGGVFEGQMFVEFAAYDYASNTIVITTAGATTGVSRSWIQGRWDGGCSGDCGQGTDQQYNTLINLRFANSGTAWNLSSYGGIWTNAHSGNGYDINMTDFTNRLWMHAINGAGKATNGCDVGQRCTEFGSNSVGIGLVVQHNGQVVAGGTGTGTFIGNSIANAGGAFLAIPLAGSNVVSDTATQTLSNKTLTSGTLTGLTNGTGLQLFNTTTTCTTAATVGAVCTTAAITLPVAYADTNYRVSCIGLTPTNVPIVQTVTKSNTTFTITTAALTAAAASFASYDCKVSHN